MSYPPIMVRQWPFDGYSRQPMELQPRLVEEAQISPGHAGLVDNSSLSQGCSDPASAYRAALASAKSSSLGQKRLLDILNAESKWSMSRSRSRSAH